MIKFDQLLTTIHNSVLSAASSVSEVNYKNLTKFFEEVSDDPDGLEDIVEMALNESDESDEEIKEAIKEAAKHIREKEPRNKNKLVHYRPKMVVMEYPDPSDKKTMIKQVRVPLLTLAPISFAELKEVKFKTEMEISIDEHDNLAVAFPGTGNKKNKESEENDASAASLEIVVDAKEPSDGLKKLIEGYDRALRAQIPG